MEKPLKQLSRRTNVFSIAEKGSGVINEDSFLIGNNLFGVFDGATGLVSYSDENGNTGGALASQTTRNVFEQNQDAPLASLFESSLNAIRARMIAANFPLDDKAGLWTTSASVAKISDDSVKYAQIGDSPIVFVMKDGQIKVLFEEHDLETLKLWKQLAKQGVKDIHHDKRMEVQLNKVRCKTNIDYGVLNGEQEALSFVKYGSVPTDELESILIFSDGMLIPQVNPEESQDFEKIVTLYKEGGLSKVKNYVRDLESSDPECVVFPRFKQYDDLTAIAIDFA